MAELTTPLMTRYEMGRLAEIKAQGIPHEVAKTRVYAERGPSGEPRTAPGPGSTNPTNPTTPATAIVKPTPVVVVNQPGISPWWGILALLAVVIYFGSRKNTPIVISEIPRDGAPDEVQDEIGDLPTGLMARPKRKR